MAFSKVSGRSVDSLAVPALRRAEALRRCCWLGGCWVVAAATLGCGKGDGVAFAPVEGRVTLDGKPLEAGEIRFQPDPRATRGRSRPPCLVQGAHSSSVAPAPALAPSPVRTGFTSSPHSRPTPLSRHC